MHQHFNSIDKAFSSIEGVAPLYDAVETDLPCRYADLPDRSVWMRYFADDHRNRAEFARPKKADDRVARP